MTKYILVGGYVRKAPDGGKAFYEELTEGFVEPVKILDCIFAESEEVWAEKFAEDKNLFVKFLSGKSFEMELAEPSRFIEQVKWADAVFLRGGRASRLMDVLNRSEGWTNFLEGKTLAGTSAGANAISKYYYSLDGLRLGEGLGLLPIKVLVHYRSDYNAPNINWDKVEKELREYKEDIPFFALREGEFRIEKL